MTGKTATVHQLHSALDQEPGFANKLMELLVVPTFVLDAHGKVLIWNLACERLTGLRAEEVVGTSLQWQAFYETERPTLADRVVQRANHEKMNTEAWCDMPRIGRRLYLAVDASPVLGSDGRLKAVVETLRDMTDEKTAQQVLEQLATRDGLTGLANRRCFDDTLKAEWKRALRHKTPLSLLMLDVDHFKRFNDTHGHLGGDECLKRIAATVSTEMRANDLVARYGGEEFAVILPNQSLKGAAIVAERIRLRVELMQGFAAQQHVTVSIGAATALASANNSAAELVATADAALYRAKHLGRNRISLP